jgi:hypothetical protein
MREPRPVEAMPQRAPVHQLFPAARAAAEDDDVDRQAAMLVERIKWAALLPYEKLSPEAQGFWRDLARAMASLR